MSTETIPMSKTHHGHSIKRIRDMLGIKQETLAAELNMTQQAFSKLEQKEQIEDEMLDKIAKILHVSTEALKTMSEEATINYINTFTDNENGHFFTQNCQYSFIPIDKIVELYERLVKAEQEKVALLEEQLKNK